MSKATTRRKPTLMSGLSLVELLVDSPNGLSLTELARSIDMDVGQTHRLMSVLADSGYVFRDELSGTYRLSAKLVTLASSFLQTSDLVAVSRPFVLALSERSGETVHLAATSGNAEAVCIARELSSQPVATTSDIGQTFVDETSAIGSAVAIAARARSAGEVLSFAPSIDREHHRPGVTAVAGPIIDWRREVVGAIAISGPSFRIDATRVALLGAFVSTAAIGISEALGYAAKNPLEESSE